METYSIIPISASLRNSVNTFQLPSPLGFGTTMAPIMARSFFRNGSWESPELVPYGPLSLDPAAKIFHYGQQVFEGMKAYRQNNQDPLLFRPTENLERLNLSAKRMAMPEISKQLFLQTLESMVYHLAPLIPQGLGESLYLRPLIIACENGLSLKSSDEYIYMLIASPSGSYFETSKVSALIERDFCRAAPGGTGAAKVAGNYGASIQSSIQAKKLGYQQNLWLDANEKKYVEEFSGMNFFAVIRDKLYTPKLGSTILPGITRDSITKLARKKGFTVEESHIDIDQLISQIQSGDCTEIFACGTAAIITPVAELGEQNGERYQLKHQFGPVAKVLRTALMNIQTGRTPCSFDWVKPIKLYRKTFNPPSSISERGTIGGTNMAALKSRL